MKKRILKIAIFTTVFFLAFVSSIILAESEDVPASIDVPIETEVGYQEEIPVSDVASELGLTEEQKERLREQRFQSRYKKMETRNKTKLKELELRHELEKKEIDREAINRIVKELKELQAAALDQRVESILKMREILTSEQFEKLHSLGKHKGQRCFDKIKGRLQQRRGR